MGPGDYCGFSGHVGEVQTVAVFAEVNQVFDPVGSQYTCTDFTSVWGAVVFFRKGSDLNYLGIVWNHCSM